MTKRKRSLIMSVLTLLLCVALFAAGTYALFSDEVVLKNHLQAGTLDITLTRTSLLKNELDSNTGFLVTKENPDDVDFSGETKRNVFDIIEDVALIVPGCWYSAEMQISNNSDVAFNYWIEVVFSDDDNLALADQLKVKLITKNGKIEGKLSEIAALISNEKKPVGVLAKKASELFTIRVEFENLETNNSAKKQSLSFDVVVHAVQQTTAPQ